MFIRRIIVAQKEYDLNKYLLKINPRIEKNNNINSPSITGIVSNS